MDGAIWACPQLEKEIKESGGRCVYGVWSKRRWSSPSSMSPPAMTACGLCC